MAEGYFTCRTAFGWLAVAISEQGLVAVSWPAQSARAAVEALGLAGRGGEVPPGPAWQGLAAKLRAYYEGEPVAFTDEPIDWRGLRSFRRRVWEAVRTIPWGATRTYGEVAAAVGSPGAARAVGGAMAANRVPIVVPCHRVLGSDGRLVGFGGGLEMKARLLALEGVEVAGQ